MCLGLVQYGLRSGQESQRCTSTGVVESDLRANATRGTRHEDDLASVGLALKVGLRVDAGVDTKLNDQSKALYLVGNVLTRSRG